MKRSAQENHATVWIVDDDESIRWVLAQALKQAGLEVRQFSGAEEALDLFARERPTAIVTDIRMEGQSGLELLDMVQKENPELPVVVMTAYSDLDTTVSSYQRGAREYLAKPFDIDDAVSLIQRVLSESGGIEKAVSADSRQAARMIGSSTAMQDLFRAIGRLSNSDLNVLITGESGTGKELVARALYENSIRRERVFIAINAAAIPADLLESELFGHEKGAFTGASQRRIGRFEQANRGTLFLDEIGDMPHDLQSRLLRVMSEGKFYRVGGTTEVTVDVRIIAATNQELEELVKQNKFRTDLFHRLNVVRIALAPVRSRREDIPLLLQHFLEQAAGELHAKPKVLSDEVANYLSQHSWPGNVREIENFCRSVTAMIPAQTVLLNDLPQVFGHFDEIDGIPLDPETMLQSAIRKALNQSAGFKDGELREIVERAMLQAVLEHTEGSKQKSAEILGWGRNTIARKSRELVRDSAGG